MLTLTKNLNKLSKVTVTNAPIIIGALGTDTKAFHEIKLNVNFVTEVKPSTALLNSAKILKLVLKYFLKILVVI